MISVEPAIEKFHLPPSLDKWRVSSRGREEEEDHWLQWQVSPQGQLSSPPSCYQQQHPGCCVIVLHRTGNIQRFFITLTFSDSKYCEYFWCHCSHSLVSPVQGYKHCTTKTRGGGGGLVFPSVGAGRARPGAGADRVLTPAIQPCEHSGPTFLILHPCGRRGQGLLFPQSKVHFFSSGDPKPFFKGL